MKASFDSETVTTIACRGNENFYILIGTHFEVMPKKQWSSEVKKMAVEDIKQQPFF